MLNHLSLHLHQNRLSQEQLLLANHPEIRKSQFWGNKLWSNSYYAGTVGNMSKETVKQYILNQYTGKE